MSDREESSRPLCGRNALVNLWRTKRPQSTFKGRHPTSNRRTGVGNGSKTVIGPSREWHVSARQALGLHSRLGHLGALMPVFGRHPRRSPSASFRRGAGSPSMVMCRPKTNRIMRCRPIRCHLKWWPPARAPPPHRATAAPRHSRAVFRRVARETSRNSGPALRA